jgi:uncharacterized protein
MLSIALNQKRALEPARNEGSAASMSADGLVTPLGMQVQAKPAPANSALLRAVIVALSLGVLALIIGALIKHSNRRSADPVAIAVIDRSGAKSDANPVNPETPASDPKSPAKKAEASEESFGVRIVRQNGGEAPGSVSIRVPDLSGKDPRISERANPALLPRIGPDGRMPRDLFARPYRPSGRPMMAIVLTGMGIAAKGTQDAIEKLPADVTLAFAPYGRDLDMQVQRARKDGHEILLQVPMEPLDFPKSDPGPHTLMGAGSAQDNIERLHWLMTRFSGYAGITNFLGEKLLASNESFAPVLEEVNRRGLLFIEDGSVRRSQTDSLSSRLGLPARKADRVFDTQASTPPLSVLMSDVERIAREKGSAIIFVPALAENIQQLALWVEEAKKRGIDLAPVSAVTRKK